MQQQYLDEIQRHISVPTTILDAFAHVPRHPFIASFYERDSQRKWQLITKDDMDEQAWFQRIYRDRALITRIDEQGFPASSSSQPAVMAAMIDVLQMKPGHKILEIGAGTGFNAAILSYLVGNPSLVTTIDIDQELIDLAEPVIHQIAGPGVHVIAGNGLQGVPKNAPYDRIIATGSFERVPLAWLEQLAPGGLLLMNLKRNLLNVMLLVQKDENGVIGGEILPLRATFMLLHQGRSPHERCPVPKEPIEPVLPQAAFAPSNFDIPEYALFIQCHLPWARKLVYQDLVYLEDPPSSRLLQFYHHSVRGSEDFWNELRQIDTQYRELGLPKREQYTFEAEGNQQYLKLKELRWAIA